MSDTMQAQGTTSGTISLLLGHPDSSTLLTPELQAAFQRALTQPDSFRALQYGPEQGTQALIRFLVDRFNREPGMSVQPENVMIVAGSTHAVDMVARLYAKPHGVALVEAPTYADSIHIFRDHQLELHGVVMDADGLVPEALEDRLTRLRADGKSPGLLYTIPNFHNPTGITLPEDRRRAIIEITRRYGCLIVEDDVYYELAFEDSALPPSFYALTQGEGVLRIGSFSKTLAPGLRLGWLIGQPADIQRFVACGTSQMGGGANPFVANILAEYCQGGHWTTHIANLRSLYQKRRDVTLAALSRYMPPGVTWTQPSGGFFIWLTLPDGLSAQAVKQAALDAGVAVAAGDGFFVSPADRTQNLRLTYSFASLADLEQGVRILGQTIERLKRGQGVDMPTS